VNGAAADGRDRRHPALAAWAAVAPMRTAPTAVETLKDRPRSSVYVLGGAGPDGGDVVAKRTRRHLARNEHLLYTVVLPRLGLPALRTYGLVDEGANRCWLFVDRCTGERFRPGDERHRTLAAHWLAALHLRGADGVGGIRLPDRSLTVYRAHLRSMRGKVLAARSAPALDGADHGLLEQVLTRCEALESGWSGIEAACLSMPPTLVHADAKPSNLMVGSGANGTELVPLDWAEAGWGSPVVDLTHVDGAAYWEVIGGAWGEVDPDRHELLRVIGLTFQWLVGIDKVSACLTDASYVGRAMDHLRWFGDHLDQALPVIGAGMAVRP
jgi:hypothetical protein